ncbi:MAG: hypothetical protein IKM34_02865 [Clostridia bacterium]|nr:hypothetical protein [Clostridia bacterium]
MSEAEKKRRLEYKQNRKKWILIQGIAVALLFVLAFTMFLLYSKSNKTVYAAFAEKGNLDYQVLLKDNDFYEEDFLGEDQAYVTSLIQNILAEFEYKTAMGIKDVAVDYTYRVDAQLVVTDRESGAALFDPSYEIIPATKKSVKGGSIAIDEKILIDYVKYDTLAKEFVTKYQVDDASSKLVVRLQVDLIGRSAKFTKDENISYFQELSIPLNATTATVSTAASVKGEGRILLKNDDCSTVFLVLGIVSSSIDVILIGLLIAFIYLTRNTDINYAIKVKKILSAYRSYIQVITNPFDHEGYQILMVSTFKEMLAIRDTIQSPILMNENEDCTCTQFMIPTNTKILYVFEIKVEDYDAIYAPEPVILEDVDKEELSEALATPDIDLATVDFDEDDDKEEDEGVEVIGVVWPERAHHNKVYRYDPNGELLEKGDEVLVPSRDAARNKDIIRKAAVAHGNHKVDPETLKHPLKKIIGVVKRKAESILTSTDENEQ